MSRKPFFSIIMVTYNAEDCIKKSLESLLAQTCFDWELRLVDGGSTDSTLGIVESEIIKQCIVTSKQDRGIYDAMNYGVSTSNGNWLFFLNAGDELFDENVLSNVRLFIEAQSKVAHIVYGDIGIIDGARRREVSQKVSGINDFRFSIPLCHQSVFYNRCCFDDDINYDTRFSVCADYHHMAMLCRFGYAFSKFDGIISTYYLGGFSHKKLKLLQLERLQIVKEVFGFWGAILFLPKFSIEFFKSCLLSAFHKKGGVNG